MKSSATIRLGRNAFSLDSHRLRWSFSPSGRATPSLREATAAVDVDGKTFRMDQADVTVVSPIRRGRNELGPFVGITLDLEFRRPAFTWRTTFEVDPGGRHLIIRAELTNQSTATQILGSWSQLLVDRAHGGALDLGSRHANAMVYQYQFWNTKIVTLASEKGKHNSQFVGHFYNPDAHACLNASYITVDRIITEHRVRYSPRRGVERYEACCAFWNHELPAGQTIRSEVLAIEADTDPCAPLERWASRLQKRYHPHMNPKTTVGWLGWSWVDPLRPYEETSESITLGNAEAIRRRLAGFDVDYIWISQSNLKKMVPGNWMEFNREHYPHGFEHTMKKLQALHFKPGLWIAPFWLFGNSEPFAANRDNLVRRKDGNCKTERGPWDFIQSSKRKKRDEFDYYYLDGSHPKSRAFMRKVFTFYRKLGIRYYMLDFLGCGGDRRQHDTSTTWTQADRQLMESIRAAAGPDTHLLSAVGSTPLYTGCVDAARVNTDFGEGRPLYPPFHCLYNATYVVHDNYFGNIKLFLQNAASSYFTHRKLWINDLNLMTVDKPVPRNLAEITATVFGLSGSPIMLGDDFRQIDEERLSLVKKCLPRTDHWAKPIDLFDRPMPDDYSRLMLLPVKTKWERYWLLGAFNLDKTPWSTTLTAASLGLDPKAEYRLFEFWDEEYQGPFKGQFDCDLAPNSCRLYRISRARRHPWLLSTTMHIQQGNIEVPELEWDARTLTLRGAVTRPKGERGSLYFLMPDGYRLINHEHHWLLKVGFDMSVVIRRDFEFTKSVMPFELRFAPLQYTTAY